MFMGRLTDKISRPKWLLIINAIIWNFCLGLEGFATSFGTLVWPRIIFAISSTASDTVGYMFIATFFTHDQRGTANTIFLLSIFIGSALAATSILIVPALGWQGTFFAFGAVGLVVTIICSFFLLDPQKS